MDVNDSQGPLFSIELLFAGTGRARKERLLKHFGLLLRKPTQVHKAEVTFVRLGNLNEDSSVGSRQIYH